MASKPVFEVPAGARAEVHIINTPSRMVDLPISLLLSPSVDGHEKFAPLASWSFLIQSSKGQKVIFDLGFPADMDAYPPAAKDLVNGVGVQLAELKHVADVLKENDVDPAEIGSVVWSHHHWDHIGDITTFPKTTEVVVGPGFKEAFLPGYPTQPDTWIEERHFEGRILREIDFSAESSSLTVGPFRAHDFFGDGSFYLLDTPGHDTGHLAGLARTTTSPDTFILMGGDVCHHGGELRPSQYLPIPPDVKYPLSESLRPHISACPLAAQFHELSIKLGREPSGRFYDPAMVVDMADAIQSIEKSQIADAQDNVLFVFAHDMTIEDDFEFFPRRANDWKAKGWREKTLWKFLGDLAPAAAQLAAKPST
ncbi:hypothetical protein GQ53DRAFT_839624 [Thozetella sp. PMI_491]|nr:hypothetical protein GQ53DRAFT_839624 [Thozetella sp. PMI_491]